MSRRPIHALIFLFRYGPEDEKQQSTGSEANHIWFANQIPDFACATVALLNIVYNIPGLDMGGELRNFKDFTKNMDPLSRGDAIDSFDFVKRIHNSFARDNDILQADMHAKGKVDSAKRGEAAAKARATKQARKFATSLANGKATKSSPQRASARARRPITKSTPASSKESTPARGHEDSAAPVNSTRTPDATNAEEDADCLPSPSATLETTRKDQPNGICDDQATPEPVPRRSARAPKPRRDISTVHIEDEEAESGFHFIAYMPIDNHVWKLDGLDYHPCDMGAFGSTDERDSGETKDWIDVVKPTIMNRLLQFGASGIEFNLMAVVYDAAVKERQDLIRNVKNLQAVDSKLDGVYEDWRSMDGAETGKDVVTGTSLEFEITHADVEACQIPAEKSKTISEESDLLALIEHRRAVLIQQSCARASLRSSLAEAKQDQEKARHRRHDYGRFARCWLEVLAEQEVLDDLLEEHGR